MFSMIRPVYMITVLTRAFILGVCSTVILMEYSGTQDVSEISRMLEEMAKELDIPVLAKAMVKAKGIEVILVKQQGRKGDSQLSPLLKSRYFSAQLDQIASEQKCEIVDLFTLWQNYCVSIGGTKADAMYIDNVHPNRTGADKLAELFADNDQGETTDTLEETEEVTNE